MDANNAIGTCEHTKPVNDLLVEYGQWLDRQRGLAPVTVDNYCWNVEQFLKTLPAPLQVSVSLLNAGTVTAFMVEYCRDRNTNSAKSMARSVRSFLRFAPPLVEHRPNCGARFLYRLVGIWHRCPRWCRLQILSVSWGSQRGGGRRLPTAATTRSCCC